MTLLQEEMESAERSPEYNRVLKILIKYQIHALCQKLSDVGEESCVLTASLSDDTSSHIGSPKGEGFLEKSTEFKVKFLSFCKGTDGKKNTRPSSVDSETREDELEANVSLNIHIKTEPPDEEFVQQLQSAATLVRVKQEHTAADKQSLMPVAQKSNIDRNHVHGNISLPGQPPRHRSRKRGHYGRASANQNTEISSSLTTSTSDNLQGDVSFTNPDDNNSLKKGYIYVGTPITMRESEDPIPCESRHETNSTTSDMISRDNASMEYGISEPLQQPDEIYQSEFYSVTINPSCSDSIEEEGLVESGPFPVEYIGDEEERSLCRVDRESRVEKGLQGGRKQRVKRVTSGPEFSQEIGRFLSKGQSSGELEVIAVEGGLLGQQCGSEQRESYTLTQQLENYWSHDQMAHDGISLQVNQYADSEPSDSQIDVTENPYECTLCKQTFSSIADLRLHMKLLHSEIIDNKTFKCTVCLKPMYTFQLLKLHMRTHVEEKHHKCSVCGWKFASFIDMKFHMKRHTNKGGKLFYCSVCNKHFSTAGNLSVHMRQHTGVRPYTCPVCNRTFAHSNSLSRHRRIHTQQY